MLPPISRNAGVGGGAARQGWRRPGNAGIDFSLVPGRTAKVSGNATSASGLPLAGETVTMLRDIVGPTMWMGPSVAVDEGRGRWRLDAAKSARRVPPVDTGGGAWQSAGAGRAGQYHRRERGPRGPVARRGRGRTVRGEVVTDDGSPLPAGFDRMQVRGRFSFNARGLMSILSPDNGRVRSDGSFEVQGVFSDTSLSIGPLTGEWTLKAIEVEGRDIADDPLPIGHGETLSGVRVVLTSRPTTIRGVLRDEKLNPAEGTVIVFAEDSAKWRDGSRMIRATRLDQRGLFTFKGLPAGDYFLVALDYVQEGQWNDPEFLEELKARAERVAIADAESKQMDLVVRK